MGVWDEIAAAGKRVVDGVEHGVEEFADAVFGQSAAAGSAAHVPLDDIRWEGMSNAQLAQAVAALREGPGASALTQAADALANIAADLQHIDQTLHDQLLAIGVDWRSQAGDLAQEMLTASSAYGGTVTEQGGQAADSMNRQAEAYLAAKNGAPSPDALRGPTHQSTLDKAVGALTGHETDHAAQVARTDAARQQAIDAMNNYTATSQANLGAYPVSAQPPAVNSVGQSPVSAGGVGSVAGPGPAGLPLPGAASGPPTGGGGSLGAPGVVGGTPAGPPAPGPVSGIGPPTPSGAVVGGPVGPGAAVATGSLVDDAVAGAAIAAGSVAAGVTGAEIVGDRSARGRRETEPAGILDEEYEDDEPLADTRRGVTDGEHHGRYGDADADFFGDQRVVPPSVFGEDDPGA